MRYVDGIDHIENSHAASKESRAVICCWPWPEQSFLVSGPVGTRDQVFVCFDRVESRTLLFMLNRLSTNMAYVSEKLNSPAAACHKSNYETVRISETRCSNLQYILTGDWVGTRVDLDIVFELAKNICFCRNLNP
jgi:hypothetical protein